MSFQARSSSRVYFGDTEWDRIGYTRVPKAGSSKVGDLLIDIVAGCTRNPAGSSRPHSAGSSRQCLPTGAGDKRKQIPVGYRKGGGLPNETSVVFGSNGFSHSPFQSTVEDSVFSAILEP